MAKSPTSKSIIQGIGKPASIGSYTPPVSVYGCTDSNYLEFNSQANVDDGSCSTPIVYGCMDNTMFNYDPLANTSNSSCIPIVYGCMDTTALNYIQPTGANTDVNTDDGSCILPFPGCTDSLALNYDPLANIDDGSCNYGVPGCMDDGTLTLANDGVDSEYPGFQALNYDPLATVDDGSCTWSGCTDPLALNYDGPNAQVDDGSCTYNPVYGCTDSNYQEYDPLANTDDGSCSLVHIYGCMDPNALNWYAGSTIDDGSCTYVSYNIPSCYFSINTGGGPDQNGYPDTLSLIIPTVTANSTNVPPTHFRLEFAGQVNGFQDGAQSTPNPSSIAMTSFDNTLGNTIVLNTSGIDNTSVVGSVLFEWQDVSGTVLYTETVSSGSTPANPPIFSITLGCNNDQPGITNDIADINGNGVDGNLWSFGDGDGYENYNFDPSANYNNGNCNPIYGCVDSTASNYDPLANLQGGLCIYGNGCIDPNATNYDPLATIDDGSCLYDPYEWQQAIFANHFNAGFYPNDPSPYAHAKVFRPTSKSPYNIAGQKGEPYIVTVEVAQQSLGTTDMLPSGLVDNTVTWTTDFSNTLSYTFPNNPVTPTNTAVTLDYFLAGGGSGGLSSQNIQIFLDGSSSYSNDYYLTPSEKPNGDATGRTFELLQDSSPYSNYVTIVTSIPTLQQENVYIMFRIKSEDSFTNAKYTNVYQMKVGFDTWSVSSGDGTTN